MRGLSAEDIDAQSVASTRALFGEYVLAAAVTVEGVPQKSKAGALKATKSKTIKQ